MEARTLKRPLRLVIALSAVTLSTAALAVPAGAVLAGGAASGRAAAPAAPAAHSAVAGFLFWEGAVQGYYDYNSAGGTIAATTTGTGQYQADFGGMSGTASRALVQATSYDSSATCAVGGWGPSGSDLEVAVDCFDPTTGAPVSTDFTLMVTRPVSAPHGTFDYSFASRSNSSGRLTSFQYNSSHRTNSSRHLGTGRYQVTLGGPRSSGTHGIVKVTAYGNEAGDCVLADWHGSVAGEVVNVNCFTAAHVAQNREFMVTYASASNLMGQNGQNDANAFVNGRGAVYQPQVQYDSNHGARVTVAHYHLGDYEVLAAGSEGNVHDWGGDVQVSAVSTTGRRCVVIGWDQQLTPSINVACFDKHGHLADSPFTVEWVVPS